MRKVALVVCVGLVMGTASQIFSEQIKPDTGPVTESPSLSHEERERMLEKTERQVEPRPTSPSDRERMLQGTEKQQKPTSTRTSSGRNTKFATPRGCSSSEN